MPSKPWLELVTPIGTLQFEAPDERWIGTVRLSPREAVEISLRDSNAAGLTAELDVLASAVAELKKRGARIKAAVAATIVRRHGKAWELDSASALARGLRFRSLSASGNGAVVFFDRSSALRDHSAAFQLRRGKISNVAIEG